MSETEAAQGKAAGPEGAGHRIVVGVDGSPSSVTALEWAARQAEMTGAWLQAVTTWEWPNATGWASPLPSDYDPAADARHVVDQSLEQVQPKHPDVDVRISVVEGHPAPVLVEVSRDADLLVVGCRGHGAFAGMLLGSVSEHCATNAHCPVLVMRDRT
jgi:nucleotide-binding universal stress UspA family protein